MDLKIEECAIPIGKSKVINDYFQKVKDDLEFNFYYNFLISPIPNELMEEEEVLKELNKEFPVRHMGISKFCPFTHHKWHQDTDRGVTVNMLLQSQRSQVLFGHPQEMGENYEKFGKNGTINFVELNYEPETFYLFNAQINHSIFNFEGDRYLFTLEFEKDKNELSYEDILKYYESI